MSDHDPFCRCSDPSWSNLAFCSCEKIRMIRADERERLARSAGLVTITRADDGALSFSVDDPHNVGWVPVALSLIPTLAAQSRAVFDLRMQLEVLEDAAQRDFELSDYCDSDARTRADTFGVVLALIGGATE